MAERSSEEPLLENFYHDDCPGCVQELKNERMEGIPYRDFFFIWFVTVSSVLPVASLFPYLYFMIRDLKIAKRVEDIGFYAGFVGASFMIGRALTSTAWGIVADRHGRKPVMILGTITVIIFNTLFGLSMNYWMAIITRFLLGALNGLVGPAKAYSIELCNKEHQPLGITLVTTAWAFGLILGPAIGGYLSQPAEKYPNTFLSQLFFKWFPYFLPSFCIALIAVAALICCIWLPETLHNHGVDQKVESVESSIKSGSSKREKENNASPPKQNLLKNWPLMSSILLFCIVALDDMAFSEIFSLWAESDRRFGGLNFSSEECGQVFVISGFSLLVFQLFLYPRLNKLHGPVVLSRICTALSIPLIFTYPFMTHLSGPILSIVINFVSLVKFILAVAIANCTFILQNNAVPQDQRGAANGLAMMVMSIFKAVAPAAGGSIFSWAQKRQHATFLPVLPVASLFPFIYFMIRDLKIAKRVEDIGFYAGFVGASFMFGRALTATAWGILADRCGRKPIMILGTITVIIFNTLFGLSMNYWMAIVTRFLLGALNGLLGPVKAYSIEVCNKEHQALGISLVATAWAIGLVVGPEIGGYLSQPAEKYPDVFSTLPFFNRFPYFLPCLCTTLIAVAALIICMFLPETLHNHEIDKKGEVCGVVGRYRRKRKRKNEQGLATEAEFAAELATYVIHYPLLHLRFR